MKTRAFATGVAVLSFLTVALAAVQPGSRSAAAPKPDCLTRTSQPEEAELAQIHTTWRYQYVPGSDPSNPLVGSAVLRATALGLAHDLAEGSLTAAAITPELLAERAIECGYSADIAVGGRGVATGTTSPDAALVLMTSEQWGPAAGIRVPAYVNGLPMRCIGLAHAHEGSGDGWVIIIMAGEGSSCPQTLSPETSPYDGGTPTATATPPFVRPTATPSPTPTPTAKPKTVGTRVFISVAKDD
jgi:hypothetical protein